MIVGQKERKIQEGDERKERKRDNKDDIAPSKLAAAFALGKDGTAVSEGGKAGRQRKKERKRRKEEIRRKKLREGDTDSWIEVKGREKGREGSSHLAMGSDSEVDKERNMDSHRRREKDRQGGSEKGEERGLRWKGAIKGHGKGAGNAARSIEE